MAGHSQFKNIMHRKGAQDRKRAKIFNKLAREISVAARMGPAEPEDNPRLRNAIQQARSNNMPKDRIERAIKAATGGGDTSNYEEARYEGYGPGGVAVIVEALTDNRNRTAQEVRSTFSKYGGNLGENGSVQFQFKQIGQIVYPIDVADYDTVLEAALEAGADNLEAQDETLEVECAPDDFSEVRAALEAQFGAPQRAQLAWKPVNTVEIGEDNAQKLFKLMDVLEDSDDVQAVTSNFEVADDVLEKLAG